MKLSRTLAPALAAALLCGCAAAAPRVRVTVSNSLPDARPSETIVVPFAEVTRFLGDLPMHNVVVRDAATGGIIPSQVTNFRPNLRPAAYDELIFQHDFAAGETAATFIVEKSDTPVPPFPSKVFARHVPERHDDFAWENDRIAHRIYGPELDTPAAGKSRLRTSGIDVWAKRVRYLVVDRWYSKGHDAYHADTGEGIDTYTVRTGRGCGGTGVWDGKTLHVSGNWASWKVLANGPIRAVFEIAYAPWEAGAGIKVSETRRFTVDAGHNLDRIASTFSIEGAPEVTVAIGLQNPPDARIDGSIQEPKSALMSVWQAYPKTGNLGIGAILTPASRLAGFATGSCPADDLDKARLTNQLMLATVKSGDTLRYAAGAGWDRSGDFPDRASWEAYLAAMARRLATPVTLTLTLTAETAP